MSLACRRVVEDMSDRQSCRRARTMLKRLRRLFKNQNSGLPAQGLCLIHFQWESQLRTDHEANFSHSICMALERVPEAAEDM